MSTHIPIDGGINLLQNVEQNIMKMRSKSVIHTLHLGFFSLPRHIYRCVSLIIMHENTSSIPRSGEDLQPQEEERKRGEDAGMRE